MRRRRLEGASAEAVGGADRDDLGRLVGKAPRDHDHRRQRPFSADPERVAFDSRQSRGRGGSAAVAMDLEPWRPAPRRPTTDRPASGCAAGGRSGGASVLVRRIEVEPLELVRGERGRDGQRCACGEAGAGPFDQGVVACSGVQNSIPCWAFTPDLYGCLIGAISETRSANSTTAGGAPRPVRTTCMRGSRVLRKSTTVVGSR